MTPLERVRDALASAPSGFDAPAADREQVDAAAGKGAGIYGELTLDSFDRLLRWLAPGPTDTLFDLGAGAGALPLLAVATTAVGHAVGVELSSFRHAAACRVRDAAATSLESPLANLELRHEDLRETDLDSATILYVGSTCFPDTLLAAIARRIVRGDAPRLHTLLSTRALPQPWDRRLPQRAELDLPATWAPRVRVVVHDPPPC